MTVRTYECMYVCMYVRADHRSTLLTHDPCDPSISDPLPKPMTHEIHYIVYNNTYSITKKSLHL